MDNSYELTDSGIPWIGLIPRNWEISRIKYIHRQTKDSFIDGDWIESPSIVDDGIRYITTGNIGEGRFKYQGNGFISEETFRNLNCTEVFPGDLVISRLSPPVGRSCIIPNLGKRIVTSVDNVILRIKEKYEISYFNYLFNSKNSYENTSTLSRGTTLTRISRSMLGNIETLVPPPREQKLISHYLDKKTDQIDSLIEKIQKKIELLKEQRTSLINQFVTKGLDPSVEMKDSGIEWIGEIPKHWNIVRLKYLSDITTGNKDTQDNVENGLFPFFVRSPKVERINSWSFDGESVLTSGDGAGVGKIFHYYNGKFDFHQRVYKFSKFRRILGHYFYWFLKENFQYEILRWNAKSTVDSVRLPLLQNFPMVVPPNEEQKTILEKIVLTDDRVERMTSLLERKIIFLKEYRHSLISSVVTGKLRVTEDMI